jgi:hypothetical protein
MTRLRIALRKVVGTRATDSASFRGRTATIRFYTILTLECGHKIRESGCGIPVRAPESYGPQKCRECPREGRGRA